MKTRHKTNTMREARRKHGNFDQQMRQVIPELNLKLRRKLTVFKNPKRRASSQFEKLVTRIISTSQASIIRILYNKICK